MQAEQARDLTRTVFQLLALGALTATTFWILSPFLVALVWAVTIVIATWPLLVHLQGWMGGRRSLAVTAMTMTLLLILVVPLYFGIEAIVEGARHVAGLSQSMTTLTVPPPPGWLESLPVVGGKLATRWRQLAAMPPEELAAKLAPHAQMLVLWFVSKVGGIGALVVQFLLTVIVSAVLYANGETAARGALRFARRLAGEQGANSVQLAASAIRGVALGVVVTAIVQSTCAGIGIAVVGVPFATILTAVIFMLCVAQIGPVLVMLPAVFWVYSAHGSVWGTGFLVWTLFCLMLDNVLRPVLIKRGADLPLLLIFSGVIGGLIAFGVIGLFIGPVVLAVAYTLLQDWVAAGETSGEPGS